MNALRPETWPFPLHWLPETACVVGGSVRDALLDRPLDYLDIDFVLPQNAIETAKTIAKRAKAGFVVLDAKRQIARVVFANATADFARQDGKTLEADLRRRDFTINAIAYQPRTGRRIDPLGGVADLDRRLLRMVSPENLRDDPLRLLRAYRQAAQLHFTIDSETRSTIRELAAQLGTVAAERVKAEFGHLFASSAGSLELRRAEEDGILSVWFPNATPEKVEQLAAIDVAATLLAQLRPDVKNCLHQPLRPTLKTTAIALAKIAALLPEYLDNAEAQLQPLKYSRVETKGVLTILQQFAAIDSLETTRDRYFWFKGTGEFIPALAVFALAKETPVDRVLEWIDRDTNPRDPLAHPDSFIDGKMLMALGVDKGPKIGNLLTEIEIAVAEGTVKNREEAIAFVNEKIDR